MSNTAEESSVHNLDGQITEEETAEAEVTCLWADNSKLERLEIKPGFLTLNPMLCLFSGDEQKYKKKQKLKKNFYIFLFPPFPLALPPYWLKVKFLLRKLLPIQTDSLNIIR